MHNQWGSIESNGITQKLVFLMSENRFIQRDEPLLGIPRRKIWLFIGLQALGVAATVAISQTIAAIGFPVLIILLIPLRNYLMPKWFTLRELEVMDDFTCTNEQVLASLGGAPKLPEHTQAQDWSLERRRSEQRFGVQRQRAGSIKR
jgi:boron transporter